MLLLVTYLYSFLNNFLFWTYIGPYRFVPFCELLQLGAAAIYPDGPILSADDLADQIAEVLNYFGYVPAHSSISFHLVHGRKL